MFIFLINMIQGTDLEPIIHKINDNMHSLHNFQEKLLNKASEKEKTVLLDYPTVYIHNW